jgi:hypothetical protein
MKYRAYIQSKVQELEDLNSSLRERDKVKDDAIAHLSDQLLAILQDYKSLSESNNKQLCQGHSTFTYVLH